MKESEVGCRKADRQLLILNSPQSSQLQEWENLAFEYAEMEEAGKARNVLCGLPAFPKRQYIQQASEEKEKATEATSRHPQVHCQPPCRWIVQGSHLLVLKCTAIWRIFRDTVSSKAHPPMPGEVLDISVHMNQRVTIQGRLNAPPLDKTLTGIAKARALNWAQPPVLTRIKKVLVENKEWKFTQHDNVEKRNY